MRDASSRAIVGAPTIGFFDSGLGGLGVWREVVRLLPEAPTVYFADRAHAPYGARPAGEIRARAFAAASVLRDHGALVVVVACNTASAVALAELREAVTDVSFVGMEPAVKPAAAATRTGTIGVLATAATFDAPGYRALLAKHAGAARVVEVEGDGWVEAVEAGLEDDPITWADVARRLEPLRKAGADQVVLGCTHYPFLRAAIAAGLGAGVALIDPASAVGRRAVQVWHSRSDARVDGRAAAGADPGLSRPEGHRCHRILASADQEGVVDAIERRWPELREALDATSCANSAGV